MWRWIGVVNGESIYRHVEKPEYEVVSIMASNAPNETRKIFFLRDTQVELEKRMDSTNLYMALDVAEEYIRRLSSRR